MSHNTNSKCTAPSDVVFIEGAKNFGFLSDYMLYRVLEWVPAGLIWSMILLAIIYSVYSPLHAIYFIIVFDFYWFIRIVYLSVYLGYSWRQYLKIVKENWFVLLQRDFSSRYTQIKHVIFLPMVNEPYEIVASTLNSLSKVQYPKDAMYVVLAGEARKKEHFEAVATRARQEFGGVFADFIITLHPDGVPGEVIGKGSNVHHAGREFQKYIDSHGWNYMDVIASSFDIDTIAHEQYFARLTHAYLSEPEPHKRSYQPLAIYSNNAWEAPLISRLVAYSTTFWLLTDLARPERLFTFSSQSMSFQMLVDIGFWQKDIVTEDSRIFLQGFLRYRGDYLVKSLYIPVYMDCVHAGGLLQSLKNVYKQVRRWAWGIENFPYLTWKFIKERNFSTWKGFKYLWNQLEGVFTWATAPIIIWIMGWLPLTMLSFRGDQHEVITQYAPIILQYIMRSASLGLIFIAYITVKLHSIDQKKLTIPQRFLAVLQWVFIPISLICFGSIPAIEACTRMAIKKYLGFWVTEKTRVS